MTLHEFNRRVSKFSIKEEIIKSIIANEKDIVALNIGQMSLGLLSSGEQIINLKTGYTDYSIWWGEYRDKLGLQTDHYDFKVTGQFYASVHISSVSEDGFLIDSDLPVKSDNLVHLFGEDIYGLTDDSVSEEFIPIILFPDLKYRVEQGLGIQFD